MRYMTQTIIDAVSSGALYALVGLGLGLVFGVMRLVNFAYGELITVGGYALFVARDLPLLVAIAIAVGATVIAAMVMERLAFRPLRRASPATMLLASFALSFGLQNVFLIIFGARPKGLVVSRSLTRSTDLLGFRISTLSLVVLVVAALLLLGLALLLKHTSVGIQMRAAADDFSMARLVGVDANRAIATAVALSALLAAAVAVLTVAQTGAVSPQLGFNLVLLAVVGSVIGGMSRLSGALLGGFLVGSAISLLNTWLPGDARPFRDAVVLTGVIAILLIRPNGLFAPPASEERV